MLPVHLLGLSNGVHHVLLYLCPASSILRQLRYIYGILGCDVCL